MQSDLIKIYKEHTDTRTLLDRDIRRLPVYVSGRQFFPGLEFQISKLEMETCSNCRNLLINSVNYSLMGEDRLLDIDGKDRILTTRGVLSPRRLVEDWSSYMSQVAKFASERFRTLVTEQDAHRLYGALRKLVEDEVEVLHAQHQLLQRVRMPPSSI
jgi:hypothetical protein